jgi:hypothetical protein
VYSSTQDIVDKKQEIKAMDPSLIRDKRVPLEQMWYDSLRNSPDPTARKGRRSFYLPINSQKEIFMMVPQQAYLNDKN